MYKEGIGLDRTILERQKEAAISNDLDILVSISPENVAYTCGVLVPSQPVVRRRHAICIVAASGAEPHMIVVNIEEGFVKSEGRIRSIQAYNEFTEDPMDLLADRLEELGASNGRIGVELKYLPARDYEVLRKRLPRAEFVEAEDVFLGLRMIKTPEEVELLRRLGLIAEQADYDAFASVKPGMTENDIATAMVTGFAARGGEKINILAVGAGERSSYLNCPAAGRVLNPGDVVRVDLIGTINGYYSDIARTAIVGDPSPEQKAIWNIVVAAHEAVFEQIRPGVHSRDIYKLYNEMVTRDGLAPINFVGHGLGLSLHEEPFIGKYGGSVLEEGMVLAIEPIHVIPDVMGFQLENAVLVTSDGAELLTGSITGNQLLTIE